jgi:GntR family transcriptional regulator
VKKGETRDRHCHTSKSQNLPAKEKYPKIHPFLMTGLPPTKTTVGMTLYKEVQRQMLLALSAAEWQPGEALPAEKRLCERFSVSIGTLRKAIDELVAEGILIRHQGRGTFVATHGRDQHAFRYFKVARHDRSKIYPSPKLISFIKGKADKEACKRLGIAGVSKVFQFTNLLKLNDEPAVVDDITLPEALFAGLTKAQIDHRPSTLYNFYQAEFGLNVIRIEERLRAALASDKVADLLGLAPGNPLLTVRRVAYSYNDQPVEWRISYVNADRFEYCAAGSQ